MYITSKLEGREFVNADESKVIRINEVGPMYTMIDIIEYGLDPVEDYRVENWKLGKAFKDGKLKFASRNLINSIKRGIAFSADEDNFGREMPELEESKSTNPIYLQNLSRNSFLSACIY